MTDEPLRVDVVLDRLCLTRSRSEAKQACDAGAVWLDGKPAKASHTAGAGQRIRIRFPHRTLEIELLALPGKSTSKKAAKELYLVVRDEREDAPA